MKNVSDNLRDFTERPKDIRCWDWKSESYLTLSAIINSQKFTDKSSQEEFQEFQDKITSHLRNTHIFYNPYVLREWFGCGGLFRYPYECLHFSLVNFLTFYNCDFRKFEAISKQNEDYRKIRDQIAETINENMPSKTEAELRWLFTDEEKG